MNAVAEGLCWHAEYAYYQNQHASAKCRVGVLNAHAVLTCRENRCYQLSPHSGGSDRVEIDDIGATSVSGEWAHQYLIDAWNDRLKPVLWKMQ